MLKSIVIRIYPNEEQEIYIANLLGCTRLVYNTALAWKKSVYEKDNISLSYNNLSAKLTELKKDKVFLKNVHASVLQQSLRDLDVAYTNFFRGCKTGKLVGYPKFKSKYKHNDSCRFTNQSFIGIKGNRISLIHKLSDILFKCSKRDESYINKHQYYVHNVTLKRNAVGQYYLSVLIDYTPIKLPYTDNKIGIDLGVKHNIITSTGDYYDIVSTANEEKHLHKLQRQFAKTKVESHRHDKLRKRVAKQYLKITNIRVYWQHNFTTKLINENQVIGMEDLNVVGMLQNHKLAKCIQDVGFRQIRTMLTYKAEKYGRQLICVDRYFASSKTCHVCGYKYKQLTLSMREWTCPNCNNTLDRDVNAAINILHEANRMIKTA